MKREDIERLIGELNTLKCNSLKMVEEARIKYLGKKGEITALFEEFRNVDKDAKREFGRPLNELKQVAIAKIEELKAALEEASAELEPKEDLTMPGDELELGSRHPVSIVREEIVNILLLQTWLYCLRNLKERQ